jgi:hypothetical protein
MGVGEILSASITLYLRNWRAFMGIVAVTCVPLGLLELVANDLVPEEWSIGGPPPTQAEVTAAVMFGLLLVAVSLLVVPLVTGAMVKAVADACIGRRPTVGGAYGYALGVIWSLLLVTLLVSLVVVAGCVLLIIPGLVFAVRLIFATNALVVEGVRGRAALRRSWELSRGNFWRIVGITLLVGILAGMWAGVFQFGAILVYLGVSTTAGQILSAVASTVVQVLAVPFLTIVLVLLYFDTRLRKEGLGLSTLADEAGREPRSGPA